ncbi:MAG: hypothetical protein QXO47_09890 [Thermoproteota archaeon]
MSSRDVLNRIDVEGFIRLIREELETRQVAWRSSIFSMLLRWFML